MDAPMGFSSTAPPHEDAVYSVISHPDKFGVTLIPDETKIQLSPRNRYTREPSQAEKDKSLACVSSEDLQIDFLYVKDVLFGLLDFAFGGGGKKQDPAKNAFARQLTRVQHSWHNVATLQVNL